MELKKTYTLLEGRSFSNLSKKIIKKKKLLQKEINYNKINNKSSIEKIGVVRWSKSKCCFTINDKKIISKDSKGIFALNTETNAYEFFTLRHLEYSEVFFKELTDSSSVYITQITPETSYLL